jgi:hypothetical protein
MDIATQVLRSGVPLIEAFAIAARKTFGEAFFQTAGGAVRHVISITPPATASGIPGGLDSGSQAKVRGYNTIRRDLNNAFAPVRLKNKRKEAIPAGDMRIIHQRLLTKKRPGTPMRRDRAQPYYVDVRKLRGLESELRENVGKLAGGWMPSANALNVSGVPQWISRHGAGRGTIEMQMQGTALYVHAVNNVSTYAPAWVVPETQRRAGYAVTYAMNDLRRQLPYLLSRSARNSGLAG